MPGFAEGFCRALGFSPGGGSGGSFVAAFVGAGGKTSALFAAAEGALPYRVIITTTTKIRDPRREDGRRFDAVLTDAAFGKPASEGPSLTTPECAARPGRGPLVVAAGKIVEDKLAGIHASWISELRPACDLLLVEADGARGLPVKAPGETEPSLPESADVVVGVIGLDCVGKPMNAAFVHRPEKFGAVSGCEPGMAIAPVHLARMAAAPEGLFKSCPPSARRIVLLNKVETVRSGTTEAVLDALKVTFGTDAFESPSFIVCSFHERLFYA